VAKFIESCGEAAHYFAAQRIAAKQAAPHNPLDLADEKAWQDRWTFRHLRRTIAAEEKADKLAAEIVDLHHGVKHCRENCVPEQPGQQDFLPRLLNGSQAKTAFALRMNAEALVKAGGLNSTGFLTLTVGEMGEDGRFKQVKSAKEASRRINNLNRRILPDLFERAIVVTERTRAGAVHFHILGTLCGRPDIRSGLDFDAVKARDYRTASPALRRIWEHFRAVLPDYGFGRAELLPIRKTGEAVASYVSKYVEKNVCNRLPEDAHKKLVRYLKWDKKQLKPNEFGWAGEKAVAWRQKTIAAAALVGVFSPGEAATAFGPRWAFTLSVKGWQPVDENVRPFLTATWQEREFIRANLVQENLRWFKKRDAEQLQFSEEVREIRKIWPMDTITQLRQPKINALAE
jgi:hypothetical protein